MKINQLIGISFLAIQVIMIGYARFVPERYFCWAPYDEQTLYDIVVEINGNPLSKRAIGQRYKYKNQGWESRTIQNIFDLIETYETTYGKNDNAQVTVTYETNGHAVKTWYFQNENQND